MEGSISSEDPVVRALTAFALGAAGNPDYTARLTEVADDPVAWVRANTIGALIRMGNVGGAIRAGRIFSLPPEDREPRMSSYLFQVLERAAPDADVIEFLQDASRRLEGPDRAAADAILLLHSRAPVDTKVLRRELPGMAPTTPEAIFGARALARRPGARDLRVMARLFPREGGDDMNLALASGLAQSPAPEGRVGAALEHLGARCWRGAGDLWRANPDLLGGKSAGGDDGTRCPSARICHRRVGRVARGRGAPPTTEFCRRGRPPCPPGRDPRCARIAYPLARACRPSSPSLPEP